MSVDDTIFKETRKAIEQGDKSRARDLLTRQLKREPNNPELWLWMSAVVDSNKERIYCLREALRIDPQNRAARRGLAMMGEAGGDQMVMEPQPVPRRNWQAALDKAEKPPLKISAKNSLMVAAAGVVVVVLIGIAIFGKELKKPRGTAQFVPSPYPSATVSPTPVPTVTPTPSGPTPPWQVLAVPYTPTPLYVNTPHPMIESYRLAIRAYERADWPKVIQYIGQSIQSEPSEPDLPYLLGEAYRFAGNPDQALAAYDQSLSINSGFAPAFLGRAQALMTRNPLPVDEIRSALESARAGDPALPETLTLFGRLYLATGENQAALDYLNAAAEQNPAAPIVYFYRAQANLILKNPAPALSDADKAVKMDLTMIPAYQVLGDALLANQRGAEAVAPYEIFIRYTTNPDPAAYANLGRAYHAAGNLAAALEAFNTALSMVPDSLMVLVDRGRLYLDTGDAARGLEDINAALKINPESFEAAAALGQGYFLQGEYQKAVDQLNGIADRAQDDAQRAYLYFWRAQALEPLDANAAVADWLALLSLPETSLQPGWGDKARQHLGQNVGASLTPEPTVLVTPTP